MNRRPRILLLADAASSHVLKWANGFDNAEYDVLIFGLSQFDAYMYNPGIRFEIVDFSGKTKKAKDGNIIKSLYLTALPNLKKVIRKFNPDIVHAHSASSYGLMGALTGFYPFLVSLWGNDILIFPKKSPIHKSVIKYVLNRSQGIYSTSNAMKKEALHYTKNHVDVINFGIDTDFFKPQTIFNNNSERVVIGTVKTLEPIYGIDYLIDAFVLLKNRLPRLPLELLIVGSGSLENHIRRKVKDLRIDDVTNITGGVHYSKIPEYQNQLSISVIPSISESFGVSALEAAACEKPIVASNVGGLPEVIIDNQTGFLVPPADAKSIAEKIETLVCNTSLRVEFGKKGRENVLKNFRWEKNLNEMLQKYKVFLNSK